MAVAETSSFFHNLTFTLRWLIQQCLSTQHMWLLVNPLCKPFSQASDYCPKFLILASLAVHSIYLQRYLCVASIAIT